MTGLGWAAMFDNTSNSVCVYTFVIWQELAVVQVQMDLMLRTLLECKMFRV